MVNTIFILTTLACLPIFYCLMKVGLHFPSQRKFKGWPALVLIWAISFNSAIPLTQLVSFTAGLVMGISGFIAGAIASAIYGMTHHQD